jgi:hypothetical protein
MVEAAGVKYAQQLHSNKRLNDGFLPTLGVMRNVDSAA